MNSHKCDVYIGILKEKGNVVNTKDAFEYAMERVKNGTEEEKQEFVDWWFSFDYIKEEDHGRN